MVKNIFEKLANPLLYYTDKTKTAVFRNFCWFENTGNIYNTTFPKANVGKALEFRLDLDKKLKWINILTPIILYFIYIHINGSFFKLVFFELLWLGIVLGARFYMSSIYSRYLMQTFGKYELCDFEPPISEEKIAEYLSIFLSRAALLICLIVLFFVPALFLHFTIKMSLTSKHLHPKAALTMSNIYTTFYPKNEHIYDMRAFSKFMEKDYEGALEDYKSVIHLSGHKFKQKDCTRLANMLLLKKKIGTSRDALNLFDEYLAKKKLSVLQKSQMLWVKSIFKIENHISDNIIQDYEDLISSLNEKDVKNQFYITSDLAYITYLMQDYSMAIQTYNSLLNLVGDNKNAYAKELRAIYAERGWAKKRLGDEVGANQDFTVSGIPFDEIRNYEPSFETQKFMVDKF